MFEKSPLISLIATTKPLLGHIKAGFKGTRTYGAGDGFCWFLSSF